MNRATRIAIKRVKRKRTVEKKKRTEREMSQSSRIIMFGNGNKVLQRRTEPRKRKPKVAELKPYLAVKLTAKLDKLVATIRTLDANDPRLAALKQRRDAIKKRLSIKK